MTPARAAADTAQWRNPLRDKLDKRLPRIAGPCGMVIFGVTGDLARKKVMPAVYDLANRGLLPPSFALVGFARRDWTTQDFGEVVYNAVKQHCRTPFRQANNIGAKGLGDLGQGLQLFANTKAVGDRCG